MKTKKRRKSGDSLIDAIRRTWAAHSRRAGTLIQRFDGWWHYSVALSDDSAISWGPEHFGSPFDVGQLEIHPLDGRFTDARWVTYLDRPKLLANLLGSVDAFHRDWMYGFQGWNCEHWARLVVSGDPISYQVGETFWGLFDVFGTLRRNHASRDRLARFAARFLNASKT